MEQQETNRENAWVESKLARLAAGGEWEPNAAAALRRAHGLRQARLSERRSRARRALAGGAIVATMTAGAMAFPEPRVLASRCVDACAAEMQDWREFAEAHVRFFHRHFDALHEAVFGRPLPRQMAPAFALETTDGGTLDLHALRGNVVAVNFWATWCVPCREELPLLDSLEEKYRERGLRVVGVGMDEGGFRALRPFLAHHAVRFPVLGGNEEVAKSYGIDQLPVTVLIDRRGRRAKVLEGKLERGAVEAAINQLLAEK